MPEAHIKRKYKVTRYLAAKGNRKGFGFTIEKTKALEKVEKYDGYQIFVTTEFDLSEMEVVESYRTFVCATSFQLRSILKMKIKDSSGLDMSIEEAMKTLERLKAVHILVGKDKGIQVYRRLSGLEDKIRALIHVFGMAEN